MPTIRTDLPDLTWKVIVNMGLQVEQQKVEEEKQKEIGKLRKRVIGVLELPRDITTSENTSGIKRFLTEEDIKNIKSKEVLKEILKLNNEANIQK